MSSFQVSERALSAPGTSPSSPNSELPRRRPTSLAMATPIAGGRGGGGPPTAAHRRRSESEDEATEVRLQRQTAVRIAGAIREAEQNAPSISRRQG